ncbi:MAG: hypothetical protein HOV80_33795 [Polyangiaceae bacterium]|nr:hypothetical protein [Polyangiaceae bacterium]
MAEPLRGVIESYSPADAVGSIRVEDGRELRFGQSACGFEPVAGTQVEVLSTAPGLRGSLRATAVGLAEDRATHANRLGARDAERGIRPPTLSAEEHAATAREIGALTILFDEEIPRELGGLLAWVAKFPLEEHGIRVDVEGASLAFFFKNGTKVRAFAGHDPYPPAQTDRAFVGAAFSSGRGALTLAFSFMPRLYYTRQPDAWLAAGHARAVSTIAKVLLERGHAVIVHRAGELVLPARSFVARLGDLRDLECVPFGAWVDFRPTGDGAAFVSVGLRAFGLPEVRVEERCDPGSWASARRFEAALFAVYCLCRGMWVEDGLFEVPLRIQVGSFQAKLVAPIEVERWEAKIEGKGDLDSPLVLVLRHRNDSDDVAARWAETTDPRAPQPGKLGFGGYEALFLDGLMTRLRLGQAGIVDAITARIPHRVITLRGDGPHLMVTTTGFGRLPQPNGTREAGSDHVELAAFVPPNLSRAVGEIAATLAGMLHFEGRPMVMAPWAIKETQLAPFLLRPWGPISMRAGAPVTVLELIPLDPAELAALQAAPGSAHQRFADYDQAASAARWAKLAPAFTGARS